MSSAPPLLILTARVLYLERKKLVPCCCCWPSHQKLKMCLHACNFPFFYYVKVRWLNRRRWTLRPTEQNRYAQIRLNKTQHCYCKQNVTYRITHCFFPTHEGGHFQVGQCTDCSSQSYSNSPVKTWNFCIFSAEYGSFRKLNHVVRGYCM
jgi:hypothetical protein